MITKPKQLVVLLVGLFQLLPLSAAVVDTEDYYLCAHQVDGSWGQFGRIPKACDIDPFGSADFVVDKLSVSIFDDNQVRSAETLRYMNNMNAIIVESATYYFNARKPNASVDEVTAWQHAIATVATVETFWSHYRLAHDTRLKMVRGDSGHGHGMMQIDDRWHFTEIENGVGWQLFENMLYSFEIYYAAWQDAVEQSCLTSSTDWKNRSRSAYSAYNGGPTRICRWSDQPGEWVQDTNYENYYDSKPWQDEIDTPDLVSPLNIPCFLEGAVDCVPVENNSVDAGWQYQLLELADGKQCLLFEGMFHCVEQTQDVICLNVMLDHVSRNTSLVLDQIDSERYSSLGYERHQCLENIESSFKVADTIQSVQAITLRTTPGGATTGNNTLAGNYYQILDLIASGQNNQHRYYRVLVDDTYGYIYAGDKDDHMDWVTLADQSNLLQLIIAQAGVDVKIVATDGLVLRESTDSDSAQLKVIPKDTQIAVDSTQVINGDNSVYYQMTFEGVQGWSYAGHLLPTSTLDDWTTLITGIVPLPPAPTPEPNSGGGVIHLLSLLLLFIYRKRAKKIPT